MTSNAVALFFHHFFLGQKNGQNAENFWIISKWQPTLPHGNTQCCWQKVNKATKTWPSLSRNRWIDLSLWSGVLKPGKLLIFSFAFASARPMHEYGQSMVIIGHYHHRRWWEKVKRVLKLLRGKLSARPPARFSLSQWLLNQPQSLLSSPGRILLCTHHGGFIHFTVKAFNWGFAKRFDAFNSFAQFGMELLRFSVNHQLAYFHPYDMNRLQFNRQIFWGSLFFKCFPHFISHLDGQQMDLLHSARISTIQLILLPFLLPLNCSLIENVLPWKSVNFYVRSEWIQKQR